MSNPPLPQEILRRRGTWRADRHDRKVALVPPADGPPAPPRPLGQAGLQVWARVWEAGQTWLSPGSDLDAVLLLCETMDERMALRVRMLRAGDGIDWRDRVALRSIDAQVMSVLSMLGFSPVDRSRLGVAEVRRASALEELLAGRERR